MRFRPKDSHWFWRATNAVWPMAGRTWTTIGDTIWTPMGRTDWGQDTPIRHPVTVAHEAIHVRQQSLWRTLMGPIGLPLWIAAYLLFPVPFGLAWFRWRMEREAYLSDLAWALKIGGSKLSAKRAAEGVIDTLWSQGMTWPKPWMRRYFHQQIDRMQ